MDSKKKYFDSDRDEYDDDKDDDDDEGDDEGDDETIDGINEKFRTCRENLLRHRQKFAKFERERREISETLSEIVREVQNLRSDIDAIDETKHDYDMINEGDEDDDDDDDDDNDQEDLDMEEMQADEDYENHFDNRKHQNGIKINQQKTIHFKDQIESEPLQSNIKFKIDQLQTNKNSCIVS